MTNHRDQTAKGSWRLRAAIAAGLLVIGPGPQPASATDRLFTYTVLPQIWGRNYDGGEDGEANLDLVHNERVNLRLLFGLEF